MIPNLIEDQPLAALLSGLYVITDERAAGGHEAMARAAIHGGARIIQLRDKSTPAASLLEVARTLRSLTREAGVLFIINDNPQLALSVQADGVHLGPDDLSLFEARAVFGTMLGESFLIGVSCGNAKEAKVAAAAGADYIGAGAVFGTQTKLDAGAAIGLKVLRAIVEATELPVAAIGGVTLSNIASTRETGAQMACVISEISREKNETAMTEKTRELAKVFAGIDEQRIDEQRIDEQRIDEQK